MLPYYTLQHHVHKLCLWYSFHRQHRRVTAIISHRNWCSYNEQLQVCIYIENLLRKGYETTASNEVEILCADEDTLRIAIGEQCGRCLNTIHHRVVFGRLPEQTDLLDVPQYPIQIDCPCLPLFLGLQWSGRLTGWIGSGSKSFAGLSALAFKSNGFKTLR